MASIRERCRAIRLFLSDVDGVLTDGGMYYAEDGGELKRFTTLDSGAFVLLDLVGVQCGLLTAEDVDLVRRRAAKIGITHVVTGARDKVAALDELLRPLGFTPEQVAYIGDDINDLEVLRSVGVSATVPGNFLPDSFRADFVTTRPGGHGAVREFGEWLLRQRGDYDRALERYIASRSE